MSLGGRTLEIFFSCTSPDDPLGQPAPALLQQQPPLVRAPLDTAATPHLSAIVRWGLHTYARTSLAATRSTGWRELEETGYPGNDKIDPPGLPNRFQPE